MACFIHVWYAGMEEANGHPNGAFNFERDIDSYIPVEVTETRLTGKSYWLSPPHPQHAATMACIHFRDLTHACTQWHLQAASRFYLLLPTLIA